MLKAIASRDRWSGADRSAAHVLKIVLEIRTPTEGGLLKYQGLYLCHARIRRQLIEINEPASPLRPARRARLLSERNLSATKRSTGASSALQTTPKPPPAELLDDPQSQNELGEQGPIPTSKLQGADSALRNLYLP